MKRRTHPIGKNTISYLEAGKAGNPTILFLHGIPASAELWREVMMQAAERGYHCLAPDMVGYGGTEVNDKLNYTFPGTAALFIIWLKELQLDKIWLVGHDLGGAVAQLMLTREESLFQKVSLCNVVTADTYPVPVIERLIKAAKMGLFYWMARFGRFEMEKQYKGMKKVFVRNTSFSQEDFQRIFYDGKFHSPKMAAKFQRMLTKLNHSATLENMSALAKVSLPVHLIWGMGDRFQPWEGAGKILKGTFSEVRVTHIDNCGHFLQLDAPENYVETLFS
ncbi:MAG: alpha/beta hydrolase [Bacteroidota bacterium]